MLILLTALALLLVQGAAPGHPAPPVARELAPDIYLLPGAIPPDRGPDGNTVLITSTAGIIVIDTGRHPWHTDGAIAFAQNRRMPVSVIVNTHWHLDHSSGNRRIKAAYPDAKLYTTTAVNRAIGPGGFLTRNFAAAREKPLDPSAPAIRKEEQELFVATMDAADALRPDVPVERSGPLNLAGRPLVAHVTANAVTDADLWLYDEATRIAVIGDLVTLPVPFFETACPAKWQAALDEVWATPFRTTVPGHGDPMTRDEFDSYRGAFGKFRACVESDAVPSSCASGWTAGVERLLHSDADRRMATEFATYYVAFLRKGGGASPDCQAK